MGQALALRHDLLPERPGEGRVDVLGIRPSGHSGQDSILLVGVHFGQSGLLFDLPDLTHQTDAMANEVQDGLVYFRDLLPALQKFSGASTLHG